MNIDESWEFRATVYSMFKSMFFFPFSPSELPRSALNGATVALGPRGMVSCPQGAHQAIPMQS